MDRLSNIHPSDMDIERYCTGAVKDQRELRALEIHLFGCPACVERAGTNRKIDGRGSVRTEAVRGKGTLPRTASVKWTAVSNEFCVTNRFQARPRAIRWVLRWMLDLKPVSKAE